jgi:hypothetical protein
MAAVQPRQIRSRVDRLCKKKLPAPPPPVRSFHSHSEPATRLVEIWNGIPGVTAITKFTDRKIAIEREPAAQKSAAEVSWLLNNAQSTNVEPRLRCVRPAGTWDLPGR